MANDVKLDRNLALEVVRVTEAGRQLAAEARRHYDEDVRRYVTDVLTDEQIETLGIIAETILAGLEEPHR